MVAAITGAWADVTVTMNSFVAISGNVDGDENISFEAAKGSAGTAPGVYSNEIRVYQNGGLFTVSANNGVKIKSITLGSSMATKVTYSVDNGTASDDNDIIAGGTITISDLDCSSVLFTCTGTSKTARLYVNSLSVTYTTGGGDTPTLDNSDLALIDAPIDLSFDLYNNSSAQVISYTTSSTGAVTIADNDYATFDIDEDNKTITVTPTAVTPSAQTITVSQAADDTYKAGSATFTVTISDSTPVPTHTVTFSVNGETTTSEVEEGAAITFPTDISDQEGKSFVGWVTEAIDGVTNDAPEFVTSATMGNANVTYYAVYAYKTEGGVFVTDVLNNATTGISNGGYSEWSNKPGASGAVYAGQSAGSYSSIQLRSSNNNSGIITTASGGKATKVTVTWNENTVGGRTLNVYGNSKAYSATTDLYDTNKDGKLLGTIVCGTSTELSITGDYEYIGFRSASGAMYIAELDVEWKSGTPDTYSDYCTTVVAATVARPEITVEENPFFFSTTATITCGTDGATIYYRYSEDDEWTEFSEALNITSTTTIYAKAVKGNDESSVTSVTATKNLAVPTVTIDASGITNTNVYVDTEAGYLSASVTYNDNALDGVTVTWSGNNDGVATIDAETGAVTLVAAGSVTFTATYAGNADYSESTATYEMTVTSSNPNAPGTENNPYSVAEARAAIDAGTGVTGVYARGRVSEIVTVYNEQYGNITYNISADGTTASDQLQVYRGKSYNGDNFSSADDIQVGDVVVIYGDLINYKGTYEIAQDNQLVSLYRKEKSDVYIEFDSYEYIVYDLSWSSTDVSIPGFHIYKVGDIDEEIWVPVTWSTSNESIATIDEDGNISFTGGVGEVEIIVSFAGDEDYKPASASITITVSDSRPNPNLAFTPSSANTVVGVVNFEEPELTYADGFDGTVTYASSNTNVAEVDAESGKVTIKAVGTTTITASSAATDNFAAGEASYTLTVNKAPASLPFAFDGGRNDIADADGLTQEGLGSDYSSSPKLKFDSTDDYLILAFNERPGKLTFDVKGNSFSGGTFKVQTSEDGVTYTDLETYTELGDTQNENFEDLGENIRYIKWIYTEKKSGNVGLGNIALAEYTEPVIEPSITISSNSIEATAAETEGSLGLTYANLEISGVGDFDVQYYDSEGEEADDPEWIEVEVTEGNGNYTVTYVIGENEGEARTAYFKVYAMDGEELVYSDVVTIIQEAYVAPYPTIESEWALTDLGDLTAADIFVIVDNNGSTYALSSSNGTSKAPDAIEVTIADYKITRGVTDDIQWNLSGNSKDGYTFYPNGETDKWLYCTDANNGVRVGTNENNVFTFDGDYLFNNATERYVGIYNSQDWRCYTTYTGNIADQTVSFYRLVPDYNRSVTVGNYGTICLPYDATVRGVQLYSIAGKRMNDSDEPTSIVLKEETTLEAGKPYIFQATASSINCYQTSLVEATSAETVNGLVGSFDGTDVDEGKYILYEGRVSLCGTGCTIGANRAYIDMGQVDVYTGSEAGVKMLTIGDTAVGIDGIGAESENGSAIYNVAGQRVQKVVRGLYIVDGKKVLVK